MTTEAPDKKLFWKKGWMLGLVFGVVATVMLVLASGFMMDTTNKDVFCASCHIMEPFQASWKQAVHGGNNPQGFAAQCVDCHLPHGNFLEYVFVKGKTGIGDVIQNFYVNGAEFDWEGNAEKNRLKFTFESACRHCHYNLTPPGLPSGGFIAHRSYLRGTSNRTCAECHPHVGHKDMIETADRFFKRNEIASSE
ncbi:MAG: acetyl-CoA carboxyl transferase [Deltaproteobacteria bacterium]|jgi:cytochrome c-type protein NapC|nr:acetyl-CoA carboxyl transferase [Deltaproteobacteria bacterium]MBT4087940.1 acetyl-CoA carboxyl transferase [Deltaproteobacteria bacterium]MBT4263758.1 acetyl-CoA carboxyl transferase [Deltaproteobacteria bacterium]MBT4643343.1 acetyl-CoA carboxyl transferase [Deltaproteobacteria bacterium]MBT6498710.1 acetyl-CoA carboxyl transferase [Deltaproteobacteria bacterium]